MRWAVCCSPIYLSGATTRGGKLLFGATWSIDAGDGIDDKCVFVTDRGDVLMFTGSDPGDVATGARKGAITSAPPLGMNAHVLIGGDLMIMTVDGIVPLSQAIAKDAGSLDQALITRNIKPMWREDVAGQARRAVDDQDVERVRRAVRRGPGPGGRVGRACGTVLSPTTRPAPGRVSPGTRPALSACDENLFFGTRDGIIMQAERTGYDDGVPYVATLVGGWELFQSGAAQTVWHQARAVFHSRANEPFAAAADLDGRLRDNDPAAARRRCRSRPARSVGRGAMG